MSAKLTAKEELFVTEYLTDLNATQAAIRAGYSVKSAVKIGWQLMQKPRVSEAIAKAKAQRNRRTGINQERILEELAAIAFANAADYAQVVEKQAVLTTKSGIRIPLYGEDGEPLMFKDVELTETKQLTDCQKKALAGIKMGKNGIEIKQYDKTKALELLMKHFGMLNDRNTQDDEYEDDGFIEALKEQVSENFSHLEGIIEE